MAIWQISFQETLEEGKKEVIKLLNSPELNVHSRFRERRVHRIYRDRVIGVRGVAAHIHNNTQSTVLTTSSLDEIIRQERWDRRSEINAVDENVNV